MPSLLILRMSAERKSCWLLMRVVSLPSPTPWRLRRNCRAFQPERVCSPGLEVEADLQVVDRLRDAHRDAADGIRHGDDAVELDLRGVADVQAGEALDGRHRAGEPAVGERLVDLAGAGVAVFAALDRHVEVAGQADRDRAVADRGDVQQDRDVVEVLAALAVGGVALTAVAADQQDVDRPVDRADAGRGLALRLDVDAGLEAARRSARPRSPRPTPCSPGRRRVRRRRCAMIGLTAPRRGRRPCRARTFTSGTVSASSEQLL